MEEGKLPPLPSSSPEALQSNQYDPFYKVTSREFWKENEIIRQKVEDFKECEHYFESDGRSVRCKKCHMGLNNQGTTVPLIIKKGKLYFKGKVIKF